MSVFNNFDIDILSPYPNHFNEAIAELKLPHSLRIIFLLIKYSFNFSLYKDSLNSSLYKLSGYTAFNISLGRLKPIFFPFMISSSYSFINSPPIEIGHHS